MKFWRAVNPVLPCPSFKRQPAKHTVECKGRFCGVSMLHFDGISSVYFPPVSYVYNQQR